MNDKLLQRFFFYIFPCIFPYLDRFLNINARVPYGLQQFIEPSHLLDKHSVHALSIRRRVPPHRGLNVKVVGKFAQDVASNLIYDFI